MAGGDDDTDYEELIDGFSLEEAKVCCEDCGIEVAGDFELETIRLALKNRYCPVFATPAELFTQLDADGSGTLSIPEVQKAFALLGGMLLPRTAVEAKFAEIDTDGSGGLDSGEFEAWWLSYEAEEARKLEREWGVLKLQSAARGWVARQTVYKAHGFKYEGSRELQLPEAATALLYNLGDGPSDWVSVDDAMELIADGTIDETTDVWTEGMDEWLPLAQCRSRFGLGADEYAGDDDDDTDYSALIAGFDREETLECLADLDIEMEPDMSDYALDTLKYALRNRYGLVQGVAEVCELLDTGGAGRLDTGAVQSAVAMLGGELLPLAKVRSLLLHEHADGSIVVADFEKWWEGYEVAAARELEEVWAAQQVQKMYRGHAVRKRGLAAAGGMSSPSAGEGKPPTQASSLVAGGAGGAGWDTLRRKTLKKYRAEDTVGVGVDEISKAEQLEACRQAGVIVRDPEGASVEALRTALLAKFSAENLSVRDVFDRIDVDGSGSLDKEEVMQASAMLGLVIGEHDLGETFEEIDADGDGAVSFFEFSKWWLNEKTRKPPEFWAVRSFSYKSSDGNAVEDLSIIELQKLIAAGTITAETGVSTDEFSNFITLQKCRRIKELNKALAACYCATLVYLQDSGMPSDELSGAEACALIREGKITENTKVKSGSKVPTSLKSTSVMDVIAGAKMEVSDWTPLVEVKHIFGLADYMPLESDVGGVEAVNGDVCASIDDLAASLEASFGKTSWKGGESSGEGTSKRGMPATSKAAARRMKKRAARLLKSEKAVNARLKAEKAAAELKAGETIRADKMLDLAGSILGDMGGEAVDPSEAKDDAVAVVDGLKSQFGSEFEERRAALLAKLGGPGAQIITTEKLARAQQRAESLEGHGRAIFKDVRTPDGALTAMKSNPQFLEQVNKVVFNTVEDLIKGVNLPPISSKPEWGEYQITNMHVKRFVRDPRIDVVIGKSVRVEIRDIELEFNHFDFYVDRRVFPKVKDRGKGAVTCSCWTFVEFELGMNEDRQLTVEQFNADVTIESLPMSVVKCNHKRIFKTLMKMFQKKGHLAAQEEIRAKVKGNLSVVKDKVTKLFEQYGGQKKVDELKQQAKAGVLASSDEDEPAPEPESGDDDDSESSNESSDEDVGGNDGEYNRLVVDIGYGHTKYGMAGSSGPKSLRNAQNNSEGHYVHAITRNKLDLMRVDWELMENLWEWMFEEDLKVESDDCCVLSTVSPYGPKEYAERLAELLFETHECPGIYLGVPAVFCLYAQGKTTGVVLDSGECITSAIPVYDGIPIPHAAQQLNFGGRDVSAYIERHLSAQGVTADSLAALNAVDKVKQKVCTCGGADDPVGQTFELPDGQTVRIDDTFPADVASQFFFNPLQLDWGDTELEESVPERLHTAVMESPMDLRRAMWGNTVVAGGNTMFQGFADALYKKLKPLKGCRNVDLKIYAPENRDQTAWKGASVVASMSSFMDTLISQETYEEEGPSVVQQLNIFSFS